MFQRLLDDQYVVGMWKKTLITDLLWSADWFVHVKSNSTSPRNYRPPSFSWLSSEAFGVKDMDTFALRQTFADILDIKIDYATPDVTGLVHSGQLLLRGFLRSIRIETNAVTEVRRDIEINGQNFDSIMYPDGPRSPYAEGQRHFLVPLGESVTHGLQGLVLESIARTSRFRRIGMFRAKETSRDTRNSGNLEAIVLSKQDSENFYPCEAYDEDTGQHTICIE